ncbi:MAG: S8 family serine peptidase, partial [Thermoanaerobaculia bacterium]
PGKIIAVSAGNEREDQIHIGGGFHPGLTETVQFDVLRQPDREPFAVFTLWYSDQDDFGVDLVTPSGQVLPVPAPGNTDFFSSSQLDLELGASLYGLSDSVQVQIVLSFNSMFVSDGLLQGWSLRLRCDQAVFGRLDGWVNNSGFARFRPHPLVSERGTVGLPSTGGSVLTVASHVTKSQWTSDLGNQEDISELLGRSSSFSSLGPTRDGRWKPDVSAPGQYLTAALADDSSLAGVDERALVDDRLLTIEGTSMASPMMAGVVALLLQRNGNLDTETVRGILERTAVRDGHTGAGLWNPVYGYGKVNVPAALAEV